MHRISKTLSFIIATAICTTTTNAAYSRATAVVPLPTNPGISCETGINSVTAELVKRGYFIPWSQRALNEIRLIRPEVLRSKNIRESYFSYPSDRPEEVVIIVSGDPNKLINELVSSPRFNGNAQCSNNISL